MKFRLLGSEFKGFRVSRFPSNPLLIRVPIFLIFSFNKEIPNEKRKRVLLGYLGLV